MRSNRIVPLNTVKQPHNTYSGQFTYIAESYTVTFTGLP